MRRVKSIRPPRQPIEREEYELEPLKVEKRFLPSFEEQYEAELEARAMPPDKMPQAATILERVVYKALWERGYRPPDLDFQSSMAGGRLEWGFGRQVADFAIHSLGIIIECQGTYWHQFGEQHQRDLEREVRLRLVPRPVPWLVYFLEEPVIRDRYRLELWLNEHVVHAGLRHEQPAAPMVEPQAAPETEGAVVVGSLPDVGDDWTGRSPINHLVNGGFSAGTAGWTSTGDVTVSIVSGKLRLNASVADKGVYQAANGLEPNALYTVACKVSTGGNSARIYTTGGHHNADDTVMTAATATWVGQSLTSSSGVLTIHLTAHTTGVDIDFDDVRLFRGNLAFPFVDDVHDVVGGDHIVDGTSMQLVGLTADDTLGLLTPSADPGAASKVLKSDANGKLALAGLDVTGKILKSSAVGARVYNNAALTIATASWTALTFNAERWDTDGFHSTTSNTSRLTVPAGLSGVYAIFANVDWGVSTVGRRLLAIRLNGSTELAIDGRITESGGNSSCMVATLYSLSAGDYIECYVYQGSGGNLNVNSYGNWTPEFSAVRIA